MGAKRRYWVPDEPSGGLNFEEKRKGGASFYIPTPAVEWSGGFGSRPLMVRVFESFYYCSLFTTFKGVAGSGCRPLSRLAPLCMSPFRLYLSRLFFFFLSLWSPGFNQIINRSHNSQDWPNYNYIRSKDITVGECTI